MQTLTINKALMNYKYILLQLTIAIFKILHNYNSYQILEKVKLIALHLFYITESFTYFQTFLFNLPSTLP